MKISIAGTTCSMGCAYAEGPISFCLCSCEGRGHGYFSQQHLHAAKCSPAAEKRCKEGNEDGSCKCACGGTNHGVYQEIPQFETIRISHYAETI